MGRFVSSIGIGSETGLTVNIQRMTDEVAEMGVPKAALRLWRTLAGDSTVLEPGTTSVIRGSRYICPPGWTGVVRLGDAAVIEAGEASEDVLAILRALDDPSDPNAVAESLAPTRTRGPGILAYLPHGGDTLHHRQDPDVPEVPLSAITAWLDTLPTEDIEESSLLGMDHVVVLTSGTDIVAAAGHREWPASIGHVGVLVAPTARNQGFGTRIGAIATARVLDIGCQPQWRAAAGNIASRRAAHRIGYREVGRQFSFAFGPGNTD